MWYTLRHDNLQSNNLPLGMYACEYFHNESIFAGLLVANPLKDFICLMVNMNGI